ncbi:unnamed protein product [Calypogeia fissa]
MEVKENVNPVGGGLWGQSRRERKSGRLGLGLGLGAQQPPSSRERAGVLAPNSTLGNCGGGGGVEALEWLKDRVSLHKLVSKSYQPEADSGSRHLRKHGSPAVDGNDKLLRLSGKSSAGLSASKEVAETVAGREQRSFGSHPSPSRSRGSLSHSRNSVDHGGEKIVKNHRFSSGMQAVVAKSPWLAANRGIEVYHDESINSQDRHQLTSRSSREVSKPAEILPSPQPSSLSVGSGNSSTPSLTGCSSLDDETIKSREPTSLADKAVSSSGRVSNVYNKLSKISKRPRSLGPACRVLRDSVESCNIRVSPLSPVVSIDSDFSAVATAEMDEKNSDGQLDHPLSDPRKRKAERDLSGGDGDTSQLFEHSSSATPASAQDKDVEVAVQAQRKSLVASPPRVLQSQSISKDVGEVARPRLSTTLVSRTAKLQEPRISATGRLVHSGKACSVPTTSKEKTAVLASHQTRTKSAQNHNGIAASEASKDSCKGSDRRHLQIKGGAERMLSTVRETPLPVRKPAYGTQNGREKRSFLSAEAPANVGDGMDLAEDMSHDGLSSLDNKENVPIPMVPTLTNCLNSLSLGEEDGLKKDESKTSLSSVDRVSPNLPSSQLTDSKAGETCRARPSTSDSARSVISVEMSSRDQVRISPECSGTPQKHKLPGQPARSSRILSENPGGELSNKAAGLPYNTEHKVRAVPPYSTDGSGKENGEGATVTSQKKVSENSHFVWVNNKRYQKLGKIGKGGSSEVFKVIDSDCNIYALKKINLKGREHRAALGFYQEIEYLERLQGKRNVVQLIDYEVTNSTVISEEYEEEKISEDACIYMVLEFGEVDLATILSKKRKEMMESDEIIDDNWLRFYWKHMLLAVKTIHDERIVHADLKPANFLLVKGELKLIDFGIAKAIQNDTTHIVRDSQVGTLNYMSPEAFMTNSIDEEGRKVKCGRSSDIWSLGCILYQMVYGHTPFSQVDSFYAKIQAITSKTHKIPFPAIPDPWLQDVMKKCLTWDRYSRPQITDLLEHPFLRPELASQQKLAVGTV